MKKNAKGTFNNLKVSNIEYTTGYGSVIYATLTDNEKSGLTITGTSEIKKCSAVNGGGIYVEIKEE